MTTLEKKIDLALRWILAHSDEKTFEQYDIEHAIENILNESTVHIPKSSREVATELMLEIGVTPNLAGFDMLVEATELIRDNKTLYMGSITKKLYPAIAEKFETTPARVERNIRHAIENAFDNRCATSHPKLFGGIKLDKGKLENSAFMAVCVLEIERRMKEMER